MDVDVLKALLHEHRKTLQKQVDLLDYKQAEVERDWRGLRSVYEGRAAAEFAHQWENTLRWLEEYKSNLRRVIKELDIRLQELEPL